MKTHEQIVEEVCNDTSFRAEFMSYVRLQNTLNTEAETRAAISSTPNPTGVNFISYRDLTTTPRTHLDSPLIAKYKRAICLLYSSLFRALSAAYELDAEHVRRLIFGVADRYSKGLNP